MNWFWLGVGGFVVAFGLFCWMQWLHRHNSQHRRRDRR